MKKQISLALGSGIGMCVSCAKAAIPECIDSIVYGEPHIPGAERSQGYAFPVLMQVVVHSDSYAYPWSREESGIWVSCANAGGSSFQSASALLCHIPGAERGQGYAFPVLMHVAVCALTMLIQAAVHSRVHRLYCVISLELRGVRDMRFAVCALTMLIQAAVHSRVD
jgi:hypothetical protein